MPFAELAQRGDQLSIWVTRDKDEFFKFGYPETLGADVKNKTDRFKEIEPDMYWEGQQMLATNIKNDSSELLKALLGDFRFRARLALGEKSTHFKLFKFKGLITLSDSDLVMYSKHVIKTAESFTAQLETRNIDAEVIGKIQTVMQELDDAIDTQQVAMGKREQKRAERIEFGTGLYSFMAELCDVGKRIWQNKNEAFYDDYVLYGSHKSAEIEAGEPEVEQG